jgi:hypothetical protein
VVESSGLLNRRSVKNATGGSNPPLSASLFSIGSPFSPKTGMFDHFAIARNIINPTPCFYACEDGEEIVSRADSRFPGTRAANTFLLDYADQNHVPCRESSMEWKPARPEFVTK